MNETDEYGFGKTEITKNANGVAVWGKSHDYRHGTQTWRLAVTDIGRAFIEMHQFGKNFTLYLNDEQLKAIRKTLNEVLE
tara:strand:+ start:4506 stop:4745 length:240 start_codon:yes stop_codon:yes gene_type:complete